MSFKLKLNVHFKIYTKFQIPYFFCDVQEMKINRGKKIETGIDPETQVSVTTLQEVSKFIILTNTRLRRYLRRPPYTTWDNDITRSVRRPVKWSGSAKRIGLQRGAHTALCTNTESQQLLKTMNNICVPAAIFTANQTSHPKLFVNKNFIFMD